MSNLIEARRRYAESIRQTANLRSERLVLALAEVPRENYLGPGPWKLHRPPNLWEYEDTPDGDPAHIYDNVLVALDSTQLINNGMPSMLAHWIDALDLQKGEHVVHAGCGTGYYTAIIAYVVGVNGRVTAIEFDQGLAARAQRNLKHLPYVEVIAGDATVYDPGKVECIFINAGATHPCALWLDSLKPQGRLMFPLIRWPEGSKFGSGIAGWGVMIRVQRLDSGYAAKFVAQLGIFPCLGAIDAEADRLLAEALARGGLAEVRSLRRDTHDGESSCLLHGRGYCFSKLEISN
jgi:protein-L-isoaspartate(D-aspartate) O-methyltransferase